MVVIDEYLAVHVLGGSWPERLPDDELVLPASRHWRLLQRVHAPGGGQLSQVFDLTVSLIQQAQELRENPRKYKTGNDEQNNRTEKCNK